MCSIMATSSYVAWIGGGFEVMGNVHQDRCGKFGGANVIAIIGNCTKKAVPKSWIFAARAVSSTTDRSLLHDRAAT